MSHLPPFPAQRLKNEVLGEGSAKVRPSRPSSSANRPEAIPAVSVRLQLEISSPVLCTFTRFASERSCDRLGCTVL